MTVRLLLGADDESRRSWSRTSNEGCQRSRNTRGLFHSAAHSVESIEKCRLADMEFPRIDTDNITCRLLNKEHKGAAMDVYRDAYVGHRCVQRTFLRRDSQSMFRTTQLLPLTSVQDISKGDASTTDKERKISQPNVSKQTIAMIPDMVSSGKAFVNS